MPLNPEHEGLHQVFRDNEHLIARVLSQLAHREVPVPAGLVELNIDSSDFKAVLERRSDTALLVSFPPGSPSDRLVVVIESQTDT